MTKVEQNRRYRQLRLAYYRSVGANADGSFPANKKKETFQGRKETTQCPSATTDAPHHTNDH